jgi:hypothetical protein
MTDDGETQVWGNKDGRAWRIGGQAEVAWIRENIDVSLAITSAIPSVFEAYATLALPGNGGHLSASPLEDPDRHNTGVLAVLSEHSAAQPWWIGYLDTGGADIVFYDVRKVRRRRHRRSRSNARAPRSPPRYRRRSNGTRERSARISQRFAPIWTRA